MLTSNKVILALLALTSSATATAAMYTPPPYLPAVSNVTAPVVSPWQFSIQGLYLQSNSFDGITNIENDNSDFTSANTPYQSLDPNNSWGFRLGVGYSLGCGGAICNNTDVNVNWLHFDNDADPQTIYGNNNNIYTGSAFLPDPDPSIAESWNTITSSMQNKFDEVNLEFGKTIQFNQRVAARFFAGLSYVRIEQDMTQSGTVSNDEGDTETITLNTTSKFNGIGPRGGINLSYGLTHGFSLVGGLASGLYVGTRDFISNELDIENGEAYSDSDQSSATVIVPSLEANLGLQYTHPTSHGICTIGAGYQVNQYWNAVQNIDNEQLAAPTDNVSFQGLYVGLGWMANS